jgi:hypothetical protein
MQLVAAVRPPKVKARVVGPFAVIGNRQEAPERWRRVWYS